MINNRALLCMKSRPHEADLIVRLALFHCVIYNLATKWIEQKPTSAHRRPRRASPFPGKATAPRLPHFR